MKSYPYLFLGMTTFCCLTLSIGGDLSAQRFGGGGRVGGGGGRIGGGQINRGNFGGSMPNRNFSPSNFNSGNIRSGNVGNLNSRPSYPRPSNLQGAGGQISPNQPTRNLPNQRPNLPNQRQNFQSQRPTHDQLSGFLNSNSNSRPRTNIGDTRQLPNTLPESNGSSKYGSRTYETANGGTITVGGGVGGQTGDNGSIAGGGRGIKITTADGKSFVKGKGTIGAQNDEGDRAVGRGSVVGGSDGQGNRAGNVRGGYADSEGNRGFGSASGRQNEWGYTKVSGNRVTGNVNSGTGSSRSFAAVTGPNGNIVAGGRGSAFVNGQFVGGSTWTSVNANYNRFYYFRGNYYQNYPNAWWPGKWAVYSTAWAKTTWAVVGNYCGCANSGMYYDYEENVTYQDGSVYFEDQPIATQEEYYDQANSLADSGTESDDAPSDEEWMPLGVFAVISEPGQTQTDKVVQLAINRDGWVRGNLQDFLTEAVTPISGALDKKTQRVALKLEKNDKVIVEVGLYNLTNDEIPVLIHFGSERQETRTLIRLHDDSENEDE